jgi:hypothetical protein
VSRPSSKNANLSLKESSLWSLLFPRESFTLIDADGGHHSIVQCSALLITLNNAELFLACSSQEYRFPPVLSYGQLPRTV